METTANLDLPYIMPAQAQKHVTHNEALRMLDALVQLSVASQGLATAPSSPSEGQRHIVGSGASGAWDGWDGDIAAYADGAWMRLSPLSGWRAFVADEGRMLVFTGTGWEQPDRVSAMQFDGLGIRTASDPGNRLAVKSDAVLFSHDDVTPGTGDMRVTLNRAAEANDAGFVFETNFETRALFGLLGDDQFKVKVSADGDTFADAISIDCLSGQITIGAPYLSLADDGVQAHRPLVPGSDNAISLGSASRRWSVVHAATGTISTSDLRRKDAIARLQQGLDFVRDLVPVSYRFKDGNRTHFGLVAQQVKGVMDKHGSGEFAGWSLADPSDPESEQGLRYEQFVPILIRAVQDLAMELDDMKERLTIA
jgi:hypothetical protein